MLESYLTQLTQELSLPPQAPADAQDFYQLPLSPHLILSLKSLSPGLFLTARIAPLPKKRREEALMHFMKANFLGQGTGGKVLAIDDEEKFLTLCHTIPYDVSYKIFKDLVEDFANYLSYWQEECKNMQTEESSQWPAI